MLGAIATTASAQTSAADKPILRTVSGYLEQWDAGTYFLKTVDSRIASGRAPAGVSGAVGTSGTNGNLSPRQIVA
jgi:hypothetical protein